MSSNEMRPEPLNPVLIMRGQANRNYNRWLLALVLVLLITTTVFVALYAVNAKKSTTTITAAAGTTTAPFDDDLCTTPYCIKAANYLLESIDATVNPCEDFFHFACGSWIKAARIPEDSDVQDTFYQLGNELNLNLIELLSSPSSNVSKDPRAIVNARNLYRSCVNVSAIELDGIAPILSILNDEFGGWPILGETLRTPPPFDLVDLLLKIRQYDNSIIYRVNTQTNEENSSIYDIELGQGSLGLQETEYYSNETAITAAYRQFITDLASTMTNNTANISQDVQDIYALEKQIAQYHWSEAEQRLRDNETIRTTLGNLSQSLNSSLSLQFNFTNYLRRSYLIGNVTLMDSDVVTVTEVAYLVDVTALLQSTPTRVVQNYLIWRFMMNRAINLPRRMRETREQFDRVFKGNSAEATRATSCAKYINDNMGFAVTRIYVENYFDDNARNQSKEIIKTIRSSMNNLLRNASWMDSASKAKAVEKELAIYENIGYPDYVASDNTTQLDKMYADYVFDTSYIQNVLRMQRVKVREDFQNLREVVDHRAWGEIPPTVITAFYEPPTNSISFPAGILQMPYFNKDAPKYLNYGGIGMVIGHEVTHAFDDYGRQYDKDGNRIPWWSNSTISQFNERKQCIVDQYGNFTVEQINKKLNGDQTQGENIADNGGIKTSFYAYQDWVKANPNVDKRLPGLSQYSPEQMFFIGYAHGWCAKFTDAYAMNHGLTDTHSIPQFRVLGPLSNFVEFDRVFSCTPGQGNSRVKKCTVW